MEIIIGLAVLGLVVWYIYKKVMVSEGKIDSQDAVAVDMAVTAVGGVAAGAAVYVAENLKNVDKAKEDVKADIDTKTEEAFVKAMETEAKVEEPVAVVEEPVVAPAPAKPKRTRKKKAK
jgi:hypothetical protein